MAAPLEKTRHPGIYRRGSRYCVVYSVNGRQRRESARTLAEAREIKAARTADRDRGEFQAESRIPFEQYAREWIERYQGNGRGGFRESTRADYTRDLERYAIPFLADRLGRTVSSITPRDIAKWIAWLCDEREQGRRLADATVRRILSPVRACLATARREGLIRANPADGAALPRRDEVREDEDEHVRVLTREQLAALLDIAPQRYRVLFRLLAATGLRWSEAAALRRRDLVLDGSSPCIKVRQAYVRGSFGAPKSRHGRRDVPLGFELVRELRAHLAALPPDESPDALAFPSEAGTPLQYPNVLRRGLKPVAEEVGAPWAGCHTLRHTFSSLHIARGTTLVQLSRLLGHHSPEFTLRVYAHLIPGDETAALDLAQELADTPPDTRSRNPRQTPQGDNRVTTDGTGTDRNQPESDSPETVALQVIPDAA